MTELIERVRGRVLERYSEMCEAVEVGGVKVAVAIGDSEVEELVLLALKEAERPLSWRELKTVLSNIVGEERLRRIIASLKARNEIAELPYVRFALPECISPEEARKVKNPRIISKIMKATQEHYKQS